MMETVVNTVANAAKHHPQAYSPHLKKVLKTYQLSSQKSLSGPSTVLASEEASAKIEGGKLLLSSHLPPTPIKKEVQVPVNNGLSEPDRHDVKNIDIDNFVIPAPFPIQQQPILTTPDQSKSDRSETVLEGETISCFVVGGERRLCLPQILNTVLSDFTLAEINRQCDRLQIFCSRCNSKQLEVLKTSMILPVTAPSCGLITQTDAERLCSALLHCNAPRATHTKNNSFLSFRIYHECFGECQGILTPALYTDRHSRCIECTECRCLFSPQHFVCHAHRSLENRTCHWGFDSTNWRSYLLLTEGQSNSDLLATALRDFKERHLKTSSSKRKQVDALVAEVKEEPSTTASVGKRQRLHHEHEAAAAFNVAAAAAYHLYEPYLYAAASTWYDHPWNRLPPTASAAAFRPWHPTSFAKDASVLKALQPSAAAALRESLPTSVPPFLSQGPPVLLHPERVVPLSESERFERQPNVALAPATQQLLLQRLPPHSEVKKEVEEEAPAAEPEQKPVVQQQQQQTPSTPQPMSTPRPAYNPEIELSSDTEDSSSERGGGDAETRELLERLARCVASSEQENIRLQGESALRTLGVHLLATLEARNLMATENQLLREKVVELEDKLKTTTSHHSKEISELEERLVLSDRQCCDLERELASSRHERDKSRSLDSSKSPCSPTTSVITSAPAASSTSPPLSTIKSEPVEPPEPAE